MTLPAGLQARSVADHKTPTTDQAHHSTANARIAAMADRAARMLANKKTPALKGYPRGHEPARLPEGKERRRWPPYKRNATDRLFLLMLWQPYDPTVWNGAVAARVVGCVSFVCSPKCFSIRLSASLKYPAPICDDCGCVMATVATVLHPSAPHSVTFTSYRCQRCGCTLGAPRLRG